MSGGPLNAASLAREMIDANQYLVLGTADLSGRPWTTPVYFAHHDYREFIWVSAPERAHSQNLLVRPEVAIVVFDSQAQINTGQGVYIAATAEQIGDADLTRDIGTFSARSLAHGGRAFSVSEVSGDADLRLYRAVADQHWILAKDGGPDRRIPIDIGAP